MLESTPTQVNAHMVRWDAKLLIVLWGELDGYSLADSDALMADQAKVISTLFPLLAVGDRVVSLAVSDQGQDQGDGSAFVEATCQWYDGLDSVKAAADGGEPRPDPPTMKNFHGTIQNGKGAEENG